VIGVACPYRKDKHILVHPPLESWLRRTFARRKEGPRLFVYFSLENGTFVVGLWTDGRKNAFHDVVNMGRSLLNFGLDDALHLRRLFGEPMTGESLSQASREEYMQRLRKLQDVNDAEADYLRHRQAPKIQVHVRREV